MAKAAVSAGADALIVHGRHWSEDYNSPCHLDQISELAAEVSIPVIGNGDICDQNSLKKMLQTGCAGIMISRSGTGQPWLFQHLLQQMRQESSITPTAQEVFELFSQHLSGLIALTHSQQAYLEIRKLLKYYFRNYLNDAQIKALTICSAPELLPSLLELMKQMSKVAN